MKSVYKLVLWLGLLSFLGAGCSSEVDLYAPEQAIFSLYGVLNPSADSQVIRVGRVFQVDGDAIAFAATHDPSMAGLALTLTGAGQRFQAQWREGILRDSSRGSFGPELGYYVFETADSQALVVGERYRVEVRSIDSDSLHIWSETLIPPQPAFTLPKVNRNNGEECLPFLSIEDSMRVFFRRNTSGHAHRAFGYQLRILFDYVEAGQSRRIVYGPSRVFSTSVGCDGLTGEILCYEFGYRSVLRVFQLQMGTVDQTTIDYLRRPRCVPQFTGSLPRSLQLEVAAVDSSLGTYMSIFDPGFRNLNPVPPIYTNWEGSHPTVGVLGSVSISRTPALLSPCAEDLLGFSSPSVSPCE